MWENNSDNWQYSDTFRPFSKYTLEEFIASNEDIYTSKQLRLMIDVPKDAVSIGCLDFFDFDPHHQRAGIGILIGDQSYREKGLAQEAVAIAVSYGFKVLMLNQIYCNLMERNIGSRKVFEKNGFELIGVKKQWLRINRNFENELMYQLINPYK